MLIAAMLTSLAACGGDEDSDSNKDSNSTGTEVYEATGIEKTNYELPFKILAPEWGMYQRYFFSDDAGTDAMTKALYEREISVEDHLGIDMSYVIKGTIENIPTEMQQMVMTGDDTYQLVLTHCIRGLSQMVVEDLLYDFNDFEYVDMTKEWWNEAGNAALEVNGHRYLTVSDYMLADPNAILVNLDILDEYNLEDPYQLVRDGNWTIDKMMEMMSAVTTDDGNGKWDHNDIYGLTTADDWFTNSFIFSSGVNLVNRNANGEFVFAFDSERAYTMVEKLDQLLMGPDTYVYPSQNGLSGEEHLADDTYVDLSKGRSLFNVASVQQLYLYRDIDIDFGVLPYPKLDETQDGYTTNDWSGLMCAPKTVGNSEMVGKAIELLSYFSEDVRYAYYEIMLGEKLTRDPESKEMLDIIFDGIIFDPGVAYFGLNDNMRKFFYLGENVIFPGKGSRRFASHIASSKPAVEATIEEFNDEIAQ